jgi:hypothetical protein
MAQEDTIAVKLCECGCGKPAPIAKYTDRGKGWRKGEAVRFIRGHANVRHGLTRSCFTVAERSKNMRKLKYDSMSVKEREAFDERKRLEGFQPESVPWNKGKKTGVNPWCNKDPATMSLIKGKMSKTVKRLWFSPGFRERVRDANFKGDACSKKTGNRRAIKKYPSLGTCERCGLKEAKHRHHIDENTKNNDRENILFLCPGCHRKEHRD